MSLTAKARIGKKRVLVIPKAIAEKLGLDEGSPVRITASEDKIIIEPPTRCYLAILARREDSPNNSQGARGREH